MLIQALLLTYHTAPPPPPLPLTLLPQGMPSHVLLCSNGTVHKARAKEVELR